MPASGQKGNKGGGRKSISAEMVEKATVMYMAEIARDIVVKRLLLIQAKGHDATNQEVKDFALPIAIKDMTDKVEVNNKVILLDI